jgi:hypothetical protein
MITIMDKHPNIGMLTPQLPPQYLQMPYEISEEVVYAKAVGNTLKIIRRDSIDSIIKGLNQGLGKYGDDGLVSKLLREKGWDVAFCRDIFCYHAGQCDNWGYNKDQIDMDPRKVGYGEPFSYKIVNSDTFEPESRHRI